VRRYGFRRLGSRSRSERGAKCTQEHTCNRTVYKRQISAVSCHTVYAAASTDAHTRSAHAPHSRVSTHSDAGLQSKRDSSPYTQYLPAELLVSNSNS
jgi:hypothetical protein